MPAQSIWRRRQSKLGSRVLSTSWMWKKDTTDRNSIIVCVLTQSPSDGPELPLLDTKVCDSDSRIHLLGQSCKCSRSTRAWSLPVAAAAGNINVNIASRPLACAHGCNADYSREGGYSHTLHWMAALQRSCISGQQRQAVRLSQEEGDRITGIQRCAGHRVF